VDIVRRKNDIRKRKSGCLNLRRLGSHKRRFFGKFLLFVERV